MNQRFCCALLLASLFVLSCPGVLGAAPAPTAAFLTQSAKHVECYDYIEFTLKIAHPLAGNPFTEAEVLGEFSRGNGATLKVDGFCDSAAGSIFRLRFMPTQAGRYDYVLTYRRAGATETHRGTFTARAGQRQGIVRVDPDHPTHFRRAGSGDHFFYNSTTAYWLLGFQDDAVSRASLDRLAQLKVNRIRVALSGRTVSGMRWKEPMIVSNDDFQFRLEPWPATRPLDIENPGYDVALQSRSLPQGRADAQARPQPGRASLPDLRP
jgi:hypothetical protein